MKQQEREKKTFETIKVTNRKTERRVEKRKKNRKKKRVIFVLSVLDFLANIENFAIYILHRSLHQ
jgi:hypothetical protein